jgi:chromate transporter
MNDEDPTWDIAAVFAILSFLAIGGGNSIFPEMHRQTVELRHWLTDPQFTAYFAIARASPGPNILIVTLIGWHVAGLKGALVATAALCIPSGILAYVVSRLWHRFHAARWRRAVQLGLAPLTVGLIFAAAYVLTRASEHGVAPYAILVITAIIALTTKLNPLWLFVAAAGAGATGLI